jgi:ABC-type glycerol-3-phosphate transport system substrate-binding protein
LEEKISTSIAAGDGPLLLIGGSGWIPELYSAGVISALPHDGQWSRLNPVAFESVRYANGVVSVPIEMGGVVMYRNQDIINTAPTTYTELIEMSSSVNDEDTYGTLFGYDSYHSGGLLYGLGGQLMDENGDPAFNNSTGLEWLGLIQDINQVGLAFNYSVTGYGIIQFSEGNAGVIIDSYFRKDEYANDLGTERLAIDPWPSPLSGFVWTNNIYINFLSTEDDNTKNIALAFMSFMLSDTAQKIMAEAGMVPTVMDPGIDDPILEQMITALAGGTLYSARPERIVYWDLLNDAIGSFLAGELTPHEALDQAEVEIIERIKDLRGE